MTLAAGTKLGPYEILAPLGAGGMGEVYRAHDTKLGRDVALKVLPEAFAKDCERMARFQREAQMLASLNHPNIASIYGLEESGGVRALVMELVEGPTLAERIATRARGDSGGTGLAPPAKAQQAAPLPLDEALGIAKQIAEALEAAHERGIIHRDLKPANIKVTEGGTVKVLDFGLAKAFHPQDSASNLNETNSPTLSIADTQAGVILGTAAYMSPEQARGKNVDRRADIWACGCVLYELLAGQRAFEGETVSDTLAAVLTKEPNYTALPTSTPPSIRRLVARCLNKDPKQRLQAIGEARIAIGETLTGPPEAGAVPGPPVQYPVGARKAKWAAAVILLVLTLIGGWWLRSLSVTPPLRWSGDLLGGSSVALRPHVSPDGHTVAFLAMVDNLSQVAVLNPDSGNWTVLTQDRSHGLVQDIAWSRDGSKVYFDRVGSPPEGIYTVPSLGGEERLVLKGAGGPAAF